MEPSDVPPPPDAQNRWTAHITPPGAIVMCCAAIVAFTLTGDPVGWNWVIAPLLVIVLIGSGIRQLGILLGGAIALGLGAIYGIIGLLYPPMDPGPVVLALVMLVSSVADVRMPRSHSIPFGGVRQVVGGPAAALLVAIAAYAINGSQYAIAQERRREEAVADSVAEVEESRAWMALSSVENLVMLARCVERFRGDSVAGAYPESLDTLMFWTFQDPRRLPEECLNSFALAKLDNRPFKGFDEHTVVHYTPPRGGVDPWRAGGFTLDVQAVWDSTHEPVPADAPGRRSYLIDTAGNVHVTTERRRATTADSTIPACGEKGGSFPSCHPYVPRQRWGVLPGLIPK